MKSLISLLTPNYQANYYWSAVQNEAQSLSMSFPFFRCRVWVSLEIDSNCAIFESIACFLWIERTLTKKTDSEICFFNGNEQTKKKEKKEQDQNEQPESECNYLYRKVQTLLIVKPLLKSNLKYFFIWHKKSQTQIRLVLRQLFDCRIVFSVYLCPVITLRMVFWNTSFWILPAF